jgi:hypothetical protein
VIASSTVDNINARFQHRAVWKHAQAMMCSLRWAAVEIGESLKPGAFIVTNPADSSN